MRRPFYFILAAILAFLSGSVGGRLAWAQPRSPLDLNALNVGADAAPDPKSVVTVSAGFNVESNGRTGQLAITAEIADGWHIYSITQAPGGPVRTQIKLNESPDYKFTGEFKPSPDPARHSDEIWKGLSLEEHAGKVTWTVPIEIADAIEPARLKITGKLHAQSCRKGQCLFPTDFPFTATLDSLLPANRGIETPASKRPSVAGTYEIQDIVFHGYVSPQVVSPGGMLALVITAEPAAGWHIYELSDKLGAGTGSKPTLLVLTETSGMTNRPAVASEKPRYDSKNSHGFHEESVTWTVEMAVPGNAQSPLKISGLLGYQICTEQRCMPPDAIGFSAEVEVGRDRIDGRVPLRFTDGGRYTEVEQLIKNPSRDVATAARGNDHDGGGNALNPDQLKVAAAGGAPSSLGWMILSGLAGGFFLNFMPCVLPVIGLKVLSFVEQSGHSRIRAFLLNLWYSLGMLAVFMALATLPVVARLFFNQQFGWGQQFSYVGFNIALSAIVFSMALSFLGVWEIPIPGFVGGSAASQLAAREGFSGAFSKGAITTVLATPCSGPYLGAVLGFAIIQPAHITYLLFASIGLGMASPYLLIGAFPQLLAWLPKPGAWMDTFKQIMGFALLGSVVYLMNLVGSDYFIPTLALLFGLWGACWWIGRTPLYAERSARLRAWAIGAAVASLVGVVSFQWLGPQQSAGLAWRDFSMQELSELTAEGKTVMLDFTADWCPNCIFLERTVLNTAVTKDFVERNGIVPMVADLTRYPEEEQQFLRRLGASTIPFLAIFPAGKPNEPIILPDVYTRGTLLEKLKQAGPSKDLGRAGELTAMNKP
jgi:suppressor for copper-sensitivity B